MMAILLLAQAAPVAPPLPQEHADCARSTYAIDQLVCGDPALRALDERMARLLADALPGGRWIEDQQAWFSRSRRCAFRADHAACAAAAYRERIVVLKASRGPPPLPSTGCASATGGHAALSRSGDAALLIVDGFVAAAALPSASVWKPFITWRRAGGAVVLDGPDGAAIARCRGAPR